MKSAISFTFFVLTFAFAYGFINEIYDAIGVQEPSSFDFRFRRDVEKKKVNVYSCCEVRVFPKLKIEGRNIANECEAELKIAVADLPNHNVDIHDNKTLYKKHNDYMCFLNCIYKKTDNWDAEKEKPNDKFTKLVADSLKEECWLAPKVDDIIQNCSDKFQFNSKQGNQCSDYGLMYLYCIYSELQLACPVAQQNDEEECKNLQGYYKAHRWQAPRPENLYPREINN